LEYMAIPPLKKMPPGWQEKILVVDDKVMITHMLKVTLEAEGAVEIAENGAEALDKINGKYFRLIISDVDMPVMSGIDLYKKAVEKYPSISGRFLFYTAHSDPEKVSFFEKNRLRYLMKPAHIKEIRTAVQEILKGA
jgi:DNA-binding response OmpR family regulator